MRLDMIPGEESTQKMALHIDANTPENILKHFQYRLPQKKQQQQQKKTKRKEINTMNNNNRYSGYVHTIPERASVR